MSRWEIPQHMLVTLFACLINTARQISVMMNTWRSTNVYQPKNTLPSFPLPTPKYPCPASPLSVHALPICPLLGPEGAFWYAPSLLARLYFFIRPSGGCQSPRGCQSTLILIRTWVLSGVNGSQQLSTGFSQSCRNSYITHCMHTHTEMHACTHSHTHTRTRTRTHTHTHTQIT